MRLAIMLLVFFVGVMALAAGGGGHDGGIPTKAIIIQAINFGGLLFLLGYFLKNPLKNLFKERSDKFHAHIKVAENAKKEAEEKKAEIKDRLDSLHATAGESLEKAKADAEQLKHKIIEDAKNLATKLEKEAMVTAEYELEKAKECIRRELIETSLKKAQDKLVEKVDGAEQKRLQTEFVDKIQAVQ